LLAAAGGHLPVVQWLLTKQGGAKITEKTTDGMTALLYAAGGGHLPVVKWLLTQGGAKFTESNNDGGTAVVHATANGHLNVLKWLVQEGPRPHKLQLNIMWELLNAHAGKLYQRQDVFMALLSRTSPPASFVVLPWMRPFLAESVTVRMRFDHNSWWQKDQRRMVESALPDLRTSSRTSLILDYAQPTEQDLWAMASVEQMSDTEKDIVNAAEEFYRRQNRLRLEVYYIHEREERVQRRLIDIDGSTWCVKDGMTGESSREAFSQIHIRGNLLHVVTQYYAVTERLLPVGGIVLGAMFLEKNGIELCTLTNNHAVRSLHKRWNGSSNTNKRRFA
jgi:hypothetical protein